MVLETIGKYLQSLGFDTDIDTTPVELETKLRPDLIIRNNAKKHTHIIDLKIPYDMDANFNLHRSLNYNKYKYIKQQIAKINRHQTTLDVLNIGVLGSWDPHNDKLLKSLGLDINHINHLSSLIITNLLRDAYTTYIAHTSEDKPKITQAHTQ